jgi:hypothetical protein
MTNGRVFGNKFGRDYYFGPVSASTGTPSYTANNNVYEDNGAPAGGL